MAAVQLQSGNGWSHGAETDSSYEAGVEDFNGNYQVPLSGDDYMVIAHDYQYVFRSATSALGGDDNAQLARCNSNVHNARLFQFNHVQGGYYNVVSAGRYLTAHKSGNGHDLSF